MGKFRSNSTHPLKGEISCFPHVKLQKIDQLSFKDHRKISYQTRELQVMQAQLQNIDTHAITTSNPSVRDGS